MYLWAGADPERGKSKEILDLGFSFVSREQMVRGMHSSSTISLRAELRKKEKSFHPATIQQGGQKRKRRTRKKGEKVSHLTILEDSLKEPSQQGGRHPLLTWISHCPDCDKSFSKGAATNTGWHISSWCGLFSFQPQQSIINKSEKAKLSWTIWLFVTPSSIGSVLIENVTSSQV